MVFCGIYPADGAHYTDLRDALEKLQLNDASLTFEPETSVALGFGFRCGFLGLLHMEIIQERLEREYDLDLITTAPSVVYRLKLTDGSEITIDNPTNYPDPTLIQSAEEPICNAHIYSPSEYVGNIMELCQERRGVFKDMKYLDTDRVDIHYELPLNEIVYDFFDALKSRTRGYASFDYELMGYQPSKLVKLDIMLNGEIVDALSFIIHADKAIPGPEDGGKAEGEDPPPAVRGAHPGLRGGQDHRPGDGEGPAQRRAGQVLRRRHHPEEEAAGKAEGGQKAHAPAGQRRGAPGGVHVRAEAG